MTVVEVPKGRTGVHRYVSDPELVELVPTLSEEFSDKQIARILRRKRLRTPKVLPFAPYHVANVTHRYNIAKGPRVPLRGKEIYTAQQAAELLEIDRSTVIRWAEVGLLRGSQVTGGAPWRIQVTEEDIQRLKASDVGKDCLSLKAAALALGFSQQGVLQKLNCGELQGVRVRVGRRVGWRIHVPTDSYRNQPALF